MKVTIKIRLMLVLILLGSVTPLMGQDSTEVWPGDANANGTVNFIDLLFLGLRFGDTGPGRDSVSINWTAHNAEKWLPAVPGRPDPAHADCNGDSVVDIQDVVAIEQNYGLDNSSNLPDSSSLGNSPLLPPLEMGAPAGPLSPGQRDTLPILLGESGNPVDSLLGYGIRLEFDSTLVDTAYAWFGNSWLGTPTELISVERYAPGSLELAVTRTDQSDVLNGQGAAGGVVVVMIDNLKQDLNVDSLRLEISQGVCLKSSGKLADVFPRKQDLPVYSGTAPLEAIVYPNPSRGLVTVQLLGQSEGQVQGSLVDGMGRTVQRFSLTGFRTQLDFSTLLPGAYLLKLERNNQIFINTIIISK